MVDNTINTAPRTIRLKGQGSRFEAIAAGTITPGHFLKYSSSGVAVQSSARARGPMLIALENELVGLGIDDNYSANDNVQCEFLYPGMWVNSLVAAGAAAIVAGDMLELSTDGTVKKAVPLTDAAGSAIATGIMIDVGGAFAQATLNNNFATVAAIVAAGGAMAMAIDALDNSGGGSPARLRIVII